MTYVAPDFQKEWFTCPNCNAYAKQDWLQLFAERDKWWVSIATCHYCLELSIWFWKSMNRNSNSWYFLQNWKMIYPKKSNVSFPNEDLDEEIKQDYLEASNILNYSPRWACALLRLALQKLMIQLWEDWKDINQNIWNLVKKWLSITIQQALDSVRVIGNEAVHPWELDLKDNIEIATKIFWLINIIADVLITQPKKIQELYWTLPEWKLEWIENRDK